MMADTGIYTGPNIGKPEDRVDGRLKVTGGAKYSAEMPISGVVYAALVMSTVAKAEISAMDIEPAQRLPGVLRVMTPFNTSKLASQNPGSPGSAAARPQDRVLSLLQNTHVYYNNQPIGVVVADTLENALHGASIVRVKYDEQQPATDINKERDKTYKPKKANQDPPDSHRGDPDSAYGSSKFQNKQLYTTPVENHNPMEPHATIAVWDRGDHLTVYDATQGVFGVKSVLARVFGLPPDNVRCVSYFVGGGFGCKGSVWSHVALAALAAREVGRPVKLVLERSQMFGMVGYRPITEQTIALSASQDGTLTSIRHDVHTQTSTFDEFVEPSASATRMLYACENVTTTHRLTRLNYGTPTFMRAPGESSGTFAIESAMDEMAYALKMDPVEFRLKNYAETDPDENKPFSSKSLRQCYQQGAERFGWSKRNLQPGSMKTSDGLLIGYGMATATYPARRSPSTANARLMPDGSAVVVAGTQDIGTGTYTVMTQIAADAIGISPDQVRFGLGDTNMPETPVSGGSQTAASTGSAVLETCQALKQRAIALAIADSASPLSGLAAEGVAVQSGRMFSTTNPSLGETYVQLMARQKLPMIEAQVKTDVGQAQKEYSMHSFGAAFAEVHVDPGLGMIHIARFTGVYGVGKLLNAKTANSQLIGGIVWGIGMALEEQTVMDMRNGRPVNNDLAEYHVPVNADIPNIDVSFVDEDDPHINPLGIKGIGEIGITGSGGAVANAVYHATGVRVRDLPITLDKLLVA